MAGSTLRFDVVGNDRSGKSTLDGVGNSAQTMGRKLDTAGRQADQAGGRTKKLGGAVLGAAKAFGPLAVAAGGAALVKFGLGAIRAASDTQQAFGAIDSVFGKNAATVKGWSNSAATDVGLARSEYGNLAVVLGSMLKNTGIEDYAGKTKDLIKLGSDLSATYGGDVNEAVGAVGSLLRGETDPIERYGVSIKQADVSARLAADGLGKLTGKAKSQAEQQTRLKLLMEQTTAAQGAFGRESNTLAGQQQRLTARFTNLKDTLGQKLLPIATKVITWINGAITGSGRFSGVLNSLGRVIGAYVTPIINGIRLGLQAASQAFGQSAGKGDNFRHMLNQSLIVAKIVAPYVQKTLVGAFRIVGQVLGTTVSIINKVVGALFKIGEGVANAIGALNRLREKASQAIPNPVGWVQGLIRSSGGGMYMPSGLNRAGGGGMTGGGLARSVVSFTSAPVVQVQFNDRQLRDLIKVTVADQLQDVFGAVTTGVTN